MLICVHPCSQPNTPTMGAWAWKRTTEQWKKVSWHDESCFQPVRVPMLTCVHNQIRLSWAHEYPNGPRTNGRSYPSLRSHISIHVGGWVRGRCLPGKEMAPRCTMRRRQAGVGHVILLDHILLGNLRTLPFMWMLLWQSSPTWTSLLTKPTPTSKQNYLKHDNSPCYAAKMVQ